MADNYRFYSFVAGLYLSPLQCGLQTAHAVSEMYSFYEQRGLAPKDVVAEWAYTDKTIIILNALNSKGVEAVYMQLAGLAFALGLPTTIFHEDEDSLNGAATATGIIVPRKYFAARFVDGEVTVFTGEGGKAQIVTSPTRYVFTPEAGDETEAFSCEEGSNEYELIRIIKSYHLV